MRSVELIWRGVGSDAGCAESRLVKVKVKMKKKKLDGRS